jgi:hypothetical protein
MVSAGKKGHFAQAPKITVEEILNRYQFIDASSVTWALVADANKNEFVEVSARFNNDLGILFNHVQEGIISGMMDVSVLMSIEHEFFAALLNEKGFKAEDNGVSYFELLQNKFEPDYGDPNAPSFFNCSGGILILNFTVDKSKLIKTEKATLVFDMQSPMKYSGEVEKYQLIYSIMAENAENMLVNNTDIGTE